MLKLYATVRPRLYAMLCASLKKLLSRSRARRGFTLMEVMIAVAIIGLVVAGGFRLISMSLRSLTEVRRERELTAAAQRIWLRFRTEGNMPDSGQEDYNPDRVSSSGSLDDFGFDMNGGRTRIEWRSDISSVPVDELELTFKRVTVTLVTADGDSRSMVIYVRR